MSSKEAGSEESKVSCVVCFCYVHGVEVVLVVCMVYGTTPLVLRA